MQTERPNVLTIAGFDPSGGAGLLADCKTFEQHEVYGFGVATAWTVQTDDRFLNIHWLSAEQIIEQLQPLMNKYVVSACKIGIIDSLDTLVDVIAFLKENSPEVQIVWDPVLKASAGYDFHAVETFHDLDAVLASLTLVTPNYNELQQLQSITGEALVKNDQAVYCPVLLKGGHRPDAQGTDTLYEPAGQTIIEPGVEKVFPKHGSGCVLSAAITARLAQGATVAAACRSAKQYVETFLNSNQSLLGYHTSC
ncbi:hydroxymethylpyrimidine/phosphomethylpyrimidine kinase [Niastella yeongjuensis]|uniref:hydroxymethylpyrimidine kinase n=1 Tax=Niastella yeongjuensis TaxID=354355 RepID=A0A1V9DYD0_9BACT|nr:hydroxymethylpyrimidine/phosphomethylpyrimidine kinase [Niastella yeongjuensis]OQP38809.1 hydroxymethylpyrimidine/phosphomethylpyrimidine kinase [Niastella yeongjuensis]SEO31738.1 hydroxymethylpyrimidine/phosphomethylpyrimidine kinase [Niastella yeongjuensis]